MENTQSEENKYYVGVSFKNNSKTFDYDANSVALRVGDMCIVETSGGEDIGMAVGTKRNMCCKKKEKKYKKVLRKATKEDMKKSEINDHKIKEAYEFCLRKIGERKIPMKLFQVNINLDATKAKFYFTAEGRVDFRALIKDLAQRFRMKIEMRQIGVRDEAKLMGGCGPCGQKLCCSRFLKDFEPVSIRMAKNQNLALNPMKITGVCGRLLCCLIYENDTYTELKKNVPRNGAMVKTPEGDGKIINSDIIQQKVYVELEEGKRNYFPISDILVTSVPVRQKKNGSKDKDSKDQKDKNSEKQKVEPEKQKIEPEKQNGTTEKNEKSSELQKDQNENQDEKSKKE